jgi:hypothetical protein
MVPARIVRLLREDRPLAEGRKPGRARKSAALAAREAELRRKHWRARVNSMLSRLLSGRQYLLKEMFWRSRGLAGRALSSLRSRGSGSGKAGDSREYVVELPSGFGARRAVVRLSVPNLPEGRIYSFSEHARDDSGDRIVACALGGFAVSDDLGESWRAVRPRGCAHLPFTHSRLLGNGEILLQAVDPDDPGVAPRQNCRLVVADLAGNVLHSAKMRGAMWHGPRAVDVRAGTLMYAEYTPNGVRNSKESPPHWPSRVWRSRDFGRSWQMVREEPNVRHFHFLQAHPDRNGEWWLTAGDSGSESRIWKSVDDGDNWIDQTAKFGNAVTIEKTAFSRRMFRLTDLVWEGDALIWGCDDVLKKPTDSNAKAAREKFGARVFRGNPASGVAPHILGYCGPEVRNIVQVGDYHVFITQSSHHYPNNDRPRVFLLSKVDAGGKAAFHHLFDVERHGPGRTGFTYSRASRRATNGTFFTFRTPTDVSRAQNRVLKWQMEFD